MSTPPFNHHNQHNSQHMSQRSSYQQQQQMQSMMPASSNPSMSLSHFRFLSSNAAQNSTTNANQSERSVTPSGKSHTSLNTINNQQKVFIRDMPDAVDEIKLQYEGQRHVVMPGYMTSADILRNMLMCHTNDLKAAATTLVQRQKNTQLSLREKLKMQQQQQQQPMATNGMGVTKDNMSINGKFLKLYLSN